MKLTLRCLSLAVLIVSVTSASMATARTGVITGEGRAAAAQPGTPVGTELDPDEMPDPFAPLATFSYYNILGSALQPRGSALTFAYGGNGCIYVTGGSELRMQFPVILPEGSEIRYVRIYYNDAAAGDMTVWLTKYQPGQASSDLTSVSSSGSAGFGTALSPLVGEIVDNSDNYTLNFGWGTTGSTQQICGVRVAYYAPLIFRDGFESGDTSEWSSTSP
jgi:hypothetical protein